jgi:hypothetical protein
MNNKSIDIICSSPYEKYGHFYKHLKDHYKNNEIYELCDMYIKKHSSNTGYVIKELNIDNYITIVTDIGKITCNENLFTNIEYDYNDIKINFDISIHSENNNIIALYSKLLTFHSKYEINQCCYNFLKHLGYKDINKIKSLKFEFDGNVQMCTINNTYNSIFYNFLNYVEKHLFKETKTKPMVKKETIIVHNEKEFNSINTILNKNIVLIKYIDKDTTLQSMTYDNYYIAEKTKDNRYKLLTRNNFDKQNSEYIHVYQNADRYKEYSITSWTDSLYNFENADYIKLAPNINRNIKNINRNIKFEYFDGITFKIGTDRRKFFNEENINDIKNVPAFKILKRNTNLTYLNSVLDGDYYNNVSQQEVVEMKNNFKNTYFTSGVSNENKQCPISDYVKGINPIVCLDYPSILSPIINIDLAKVKQIEKMYNKFPSFLKMVQETIDNESIEEQEQRINNTHIPINKHVTDLSIGINEDYLLLD